MLQGGRKGFESDGLELGFGRSGALNERGRDEREAQYIDILADTR